MTHEGWKKLITSAAQDPKRLDLLAQLLVEVDQCKARLIEAGVSWTGRPLRESIEELVSR